MREALFLYIESLGMAWAFLYVEVRFDRHQ